MPIKTSGAKIDSSTQDELLSKTVDASGFGGATANQSSGFLGIGGGTTGASLAGVTASFASNVSNAIDQYEQNIRSILEQLENANSQVAFQGSGIKSALTTFINAVKTVANSYLTKLSAAETQIVNSVASAYQTQDADLSGDMTSDSGNLQSQGFGSN